MSPEPVPKDALDQGRRVSHTPGMARGGGRVVAVGAVAAAAVIAAVAASIVAVRKSDEAHRARDAEAAQELAAAALTANQQSPERGLLLALEAYERDGSYAARNALL